MPDIPASNPLSIYYKSIAYLQSNRTADIDYVKWERNYTQEFLIEVKLRGMGPLNVCACPGMPLPFAPYIGPAGIEFDLRARAIHYTATRFVTDDEGEYALWKATVNYSTNFRNIPTQGDWPSPPGETKNNDPGDDPSLEPMELEWDYEDMELNLLADLDNKKFVNTADQPLTYMYKAPVHVLTVSRNELTFDPDRSDTYANTVNSNMFLNRPPGQVMLTPPRARLAFRGDLPYFRVTYKLKLSPKMPDDSFPDWQPRILSVGTMERQTDISKPNFNKPIPIIRQGTQVTSPVLLDAAGVALIGIAAQDIIPFYIKRRVFKSVDFTQLFQQGMNFPGATGPIPPVAAYVLGLT
jgi:hypothetical protein